jgi:DNA mismatch repair protein MutS
MRPMCWQRVDFLAALAELAAARNYVPPKVTLDDESILDIRDGRHPHHRPEHGRQEHLHPPGRPAVLLAQTGSFIPAKSARSAWPTASSPASGQRRLTRGQSTFMVEMTETANILNNATSRSRW